MCKLESFSHLPNSHLETREVEDHVAIPKAFNNCSALQNSVSFKIWLLIRLHKDLDHRKM